MNYENPSHEINNLLAGLPSKNYNHLLANCEKVDLVFGEVLCEAGEPINHVYFPIESFISLIIPVDTNASLEVGLIGNEGMYGVPLLLGHDVSIQHALVQGGGSAWRMKTRQFVLEFKRSPILQQRLNSYLYVLMSQLTRMAACLRFHLIEARLARWLLMTQDRAHSNVFHITHTFLAFMLGVRRAGVTKAASALQKQKLISYTRGDVTILDRNGLKAVACSCYQADKKIYRSIMV